MSVSHAKRLSQDENGSLIDGLHALANDLAVDFHIMQDLREFPGACSNQPLMEAKIAEEPQFKDVLYVPMNMLKQCQA